MLLADQFAQADIATMKAEERADERMETLIKIFSRGGNEEQARTFLDATDDEIAAAKKKAGINN